MSGYFLTDWPPEGRQQQGWQQEGAARFRVGDAFFRASSQRGRDLAVLAALAAKSTAPADFRVLDAMTGCGVRPLRYALEAGADYVWANEGNPNLHPCLLANLSHALPSQRYCITHQDANAVFFDCYQRQDFYDLIDVDGFGSPMPVLASALWAVRLGGLIYLTSTDGRATSGHAPHKAVQTYGAAARSHPAVHEQGLRLLIGLAMQQAAARGLSARPLFSLYQGEVNRVMMRITRAGEWPAAHYGFLAYCHGCGQFQTVAWKKLGRVTCHCQQGSAHENAGDGNLVLSGPMWLGPLHDSEMLTAMQAIAHSKLAQPSSPAALTPMDADAPNNLPDTRWRQCEALLSTMKSEANLPPYFYSLAEIGKRGKTDIPPKRRLIECLQQAGFRATLTHISSQAVKTDAPMAVCLQLARQLSQ
jgi:tRNA (guanine26-N2/guanine27-N2)-dimethyltransferase